MKIVLVVGLPGSGKTYYASQMMTEKSVMIDDIVSLEQLPDHAEELFITDVNFCNADILEQAKDMLRDKYGNISIEVVYFENNPSRARANVQHRNDGREVEGTILRFEKIYSPPDTARSIWRPNQ